jgi:YD repeat-containing protein
MHAESMNDAELINVAVKDKSVHGVNESEDDTVAYAQVHGHAFAAIQAGYSVNKDNGSLQSAESIDFPFTAPPPEDTSDEYVKSKRDMIRSMVNENKNINRLQKKRLINMLLKYEQCFSMKGENLKQTDVAEHVIETGDNLPFRERLRPYSPPVQSIIDKEVAKMIKQGVLVPSRSPYASNLLLVRKPDESEASGMKDRVCASFVRLNKHTTKDSYPLPNIQSIFDSIGKSKWFSTMDLLSGFWQVMIKPEHRHKTAVITARGLYEYVVMAFGLCNAPATFQRLMDAIILPEYRDFIQTYIDDILTHSPTFEDHLIHLDTMLALLQKNKLMVKLSKCRFAQIEVKFLGHVISQGEIKCNPETVNVIKAWKRPLPGKTAVTAVRSFLGMVGWYRRFIPNCSAICRPLYALTKKGVKFEWTDECEQSFITLRDALTSSPVLKTADPNKPYWLHTDGSNHALGTCLMQKDENDHLHPIAYGSKLLNAAQRNYTVTDRECLAIVWALEHFNTYLEGHKYTVVTDHAALQYLRSTTHSKQRMHRLALKLQPYELVYEYAPGATHYAADLLSRAPVTMESDSSVSNVLALNVKKKKKRRVLSKEYQVESITNKRLIEGRELDYEYEVHWKGYDDPTWEPLDHLQNAIDTVIRYESECVENIGYTPITLSKLTSNDDIYDDNCTECIERMTPVQRHVHNYKVHSIPVPTTDLHIDTFDTDSVLFKQLQLDDPQFRFIYDTVLGTVNMDDEQLTESERRVLRTHEFVYDENGNLHCIDLPGVRTKSRVRTRLRLCIPRAVRERVMKYAHNSKLSNHPGVVHMYDLLREAVWWPHMLSDIAQYVFKCVDCLKGKRKQRKILTQPMSVSSTPWSVVATDFVGPLPLTDRGNKYILVNIDTFTRMVEATATADDTTTTTANVIINDVICRHGLFDVLRSDRGTNYVQLLAANIYRQLGIKQIKTSAWHPQSNGVVEIVNGVLKLTLKIFANEHGNDWDILLPYAVVAYNTAFHSTIQETPFYMNYGRDAQTLVQRCLGIRPNGDSTTTHQYAVDLAQRLFDVHTRVVDIYNQVNDGRIDFNVGQTIPSFKVNDMVYLHDATTTKGINRKLKRRWKGPFRVLEKTSDVNYKLERDGYVQAVHVQRMRAVVDHDVSLQSYDYDLSVAAEELDAINKTIENLSGRRMILQQEQEKLAAAREVNVEIVVNTMHVCGSLAITTCASVKSVNGYLL